MNADRLPAVLVRAVVVLGAVLVVLAATRAEPFPVAVLAAGVAAGLARPAVVGGWVALPAAAWTLVAGGTPSPGAVLVGVAGGYLLHTGLAAAAVVPWGAVVSAAVVRRWALRCLPAVVVTAVVAGVDAVIGSTPRSTLFAVVAVGLVLLAAGGLARLLAGAGAGEAVQREPRP